MDRITCKYITLLNFFVGNILSILRVESTHYIEELTAQYHGHLLYFESFACRNAPGTSKVTTYFPSCASTTRVENNSSSYTVGDATVSAFYLCNAAVL